MLNRIFLGMLVISLAVGFFQGRGDRMTESLLEESASAVKLAIEMAGVMGLWSGLMKAAEKAGLAAVIGKFFSPFTKRLFPELSRRELKDGKPAEGSALEAITLNLSANFLGLGNAATPLGITAMERMAAASPGTRYATDEMVMFLVCNTAAVQIFPSTLAAVRQAAGAARPLDVLPAVWVSSLVTLAVSVGAACGMSRLIRQEKRYFLKGRQKI